jgi:hypothetical protein
LVCDANIVGITNEGELVVVRLGLDLIAITKDELDTSSDDSGVSKDIIGGLVVTSDLGIDLVRSRRGIVRFG